MSLRRSRVRSVAGVSLSTLLLWTLAATAAAAAGPAPISSRQSYRSGSHHGSSGHYRSGGSYRGHGHYRGSQDRAAGDAYQAQYQRQLDALHVSGGSRLPSSLFDGSSYYGGAPYAVAPSYVVHVPIDPGYQPPPVEPLIEPAPAPAPQPIYIVVQTPAAAPVAATPPAPTPLAESVPAAPRPRSSTPGEVRIEVHPPEASVYLDDRLLGTGEEVSLAQALRLRPGVHLLEVTHPNHPAQRLVFGVTSGAPMQVEIDLEATRADRRTRLATSEEIPLVLSR